jgi:hypothetical protein
MKVVNVYLPHSEKRHDYHHPGIGDFLRGSVCLFQICEELGIDFEINFSKHPIQSTFARRSPFISQATEAIPYFPANSRRALTRTIRKRRDDDTLVLFTNCCPEHPPSDECRRQLLAEIAPSDQIRLAVSSLISSFGSYDVLHVRLADAFFSEVEALSRGTVDVVLNACANAQRRLIVLTSSPALKRVVENASMPNVTTLAGIPRHCGYHSDLEGTMIDFHMMAKAQHILQVSEYSWGSGFSEWCAKLNGIRLTRLSVPDR